jgi:hypothetical protein
MKHGEGKGGQWNGKAAHDSGCSQKRGDRSLQITAF